MVGEKAVDGGASSGNRSGQVRWIVRDEARLAPLQVSVVREDQAEVRLEVAVIGEAFLPPREPKWCTCTQQKEANATVSSRTIAACLPLPEH